MASPTALPRPAVAVAAPPRPPLPTLHRRVRDVSRPPRFSAEHPSSSHDAQTTVTPPSVLLRRSRARSLAGVHLSRRRRAVRSLRPCHDFGHAKGSGHAIPPVKAEPCAASRARAQPCLCSTSACVPSCPRRARRPCLAHAREHKPSTALPAVSRPWLGQAPACVSRPVHAACLPCAHQSLLRC